MDENIKNYNDIIDKFEAMPEFKLNSINVTSLQCSAIVSIAISLKRIADKLEVSQKQPILMTADEALKFYAAKDGY